MKYLLDTHTFLWAISDAKELSKKAKKIFLNSDNSLFLSMASIWEMAIKYSLGKLTLTQSLKHFIPEQLHVNNITMLNIEFQHIIKVASLPFHHRDPFDRLLVAQALVDRITLLSGDDILDAYKIERIW